MCKRKIYKPKQGLEPWIQNKASWTGDSLFIEVYLTAHTDQPTKK